MTNQKRGNRELHVPVFLQEILGNLSGPDAKIIDGTLGDGGHSKALLRASGPNTSLLGLDLDTEAVERAGKELEEFGSQARIVNDTFAHIEEVVNREKFFAPTGILFDLGMSTHHLQVERGFSFQNTGVLDMRFNGKGNISLPQPEKASLRKLAQRFNSFTAAQVVNQLRKDELSELIQEYGEERFAERIAEAIVSRRRDQPIENVQDLVQIIVSAYPASARHGRIHVATRTFQALRIAVNREYETLRQGIEQALRVLTKGGRLAVISFHSGEDRIVKQMFKAVSSEEYSLLTKHPLKPTYAEVQENSWSRSAKLRIIERK